MSWDIPDWLAEDLEFEYGNDLQQGHVAEVMYHGERPFYNLRQVKSKLQKYHEDTVRSRLNEMVELGVLKKNTINNGDIWWIKYPETDYPKPPDAELTPISTDPTVWEFFGKLHVLIASVSILFAAGSGAFIWAGVLVSTGSLQLPWSSSYILSIGLTIILVAYLFLLAAIGVWIANRATGGALEELSFESIDL